MALDPQAQAIADQLAQLPQPDLATLGAVEYRAGLAAMMPPPPQIHPEVIGTDLTLAGAAGKLPARSYRPPLAGKLPLVVFFHGGGFVGCGLDTHDNLCRRLAALSEALVVSVDYRLAPEYPFPAPVEDAVAAVKAVHQQAASLDADPERIAVAGDSAGGNLAAVAALLLRDSGITLCHQLLLYPVTDAACDSASYRENADAPMLGKAMMAWFWKQYLPNAEDGLDPRASPLRASDLSRLPAATVITAGADPLRDEGEAYGLALAAAGVTTTLRRWPQQFHGFASLLGALDGADEALAFAAAQLRHAFQ